MNHRHNPLICAALGIIGAAASTAPAAQILNNTSFEAAPTTPVTPNDWQYNGQATHDNSKPRTGTFEAFLNNTLQGSNSNVQEQTAFGTVTPGTTYTLSLYTVANYGTGGIGQAQLEFLNSTGGVLVTDFLPNLPTSTTYTNSTAAFIAPANSSAAFVLISAVTGAITGSTSTVYVDDVTLTSAAVPEPATLGVVAAGGAGLLLRRRRAR